MNDQGLIGARVEVIGVGESVSLATVRSVTDGRVLVEYDNGFLVAIDLDHMAVRMVRDRDVSTGVDACRNDLEMALGKLEAQGKSMHTIMDQLDVTTERWRKIDSERNEVRAILRAADTESTEKAAQRVKEDAVGCDSFRIERDHAWDELHKVLGMIGDHPRGVTRAIDAVKRVIAERDAASMELEAVECALKRSDAQVVELLGRIADAGVRSNKAVAILHENIVGPDR